ncbi:MAG: hypothetical protein HOV68_11360 [Streptomycetaceae bacterium]|nr:hypothetical protein [Streptomycetaceae bacterium]
MLNTTFDRRHPWHVIGVIVIVVIIIVSGQLGTAADIAALFAVLLSI